MVEVLLLALRILQIHPFILLVAVRRGGSSFASARSEGYTPYDGSFSASATPREYTPYGGSSPTSTTPRGNTIYERSVSASKTPSKSAAKSTTPSKSNAKSTRSEKSSLPSWDYPMCRNGLRVCSVYQPSRKGTIIEIVEKYHTSNA